MGEFYPRRRSWDLISDLEVECRRYQRGNFYPPAFVMTRTSTLPYGYIREVIGLLGPPPLDLLEDGLISDKFFDGQGERHFPMRKSTIAVFPRTFVG